MIIDIKKCNIRIFYEQDISQIYKTFHKYIGHFIYLQDTSQIHRTLHRCIGHFIDVQDIMQKGLIIIGHIKIRHIYHRQRKICFLPYKFYYHPVPCLFCMFCIYYKYLLHIFFSPVVNQSKSEHELHELHATEHVFF